MNAPLSMAMRETRLVVGPPVDRVRHKCWGLLDDVLFGWLLSVVKAGRIFYLHLAPPCTTFSQARRPPLRTRRCPYGLEPADAETRNGTRLFQRCWLLLLLQKRAGTQGSLEHPAGAVSQHFPCVAASIGAAVSEVGLDMCAYGAPMEESDENVLRERVLVAWLRASLSGWSSACPVGRWSQ